MFLGPGRSHQGESLLWASLMSIYINILLPCGWVFLFPFAKVSQSFSRYPERAGLYSAPFLCCTSLNHTFILPTTFLCPSHITIIRSASLSSFNDTLAICIPPSSHVQRCCLHLHHLPWPPEQLPSQTCAAIPSGTRPSPGKLRLCKPCGPGEATLKVTLCQTRAYPSSSR